MHSEGQELVANLQGSEDKRGNQVITYGRGVNECITKIIDAQSYEMGTAMNTAGKAKWGEAVILQSPSTVCNSKMELENCPKTEGLLGLGGKGNDEIILLPHDNCMLETRNEKGKSISIKV